MRIDGYRAINTHYPTQSRAARPDQKARNPSQGTRPQLEKRSVWGAPCDRSLGTRTRRAGLVTLVETRPWCMHLRLILVTFDRIRGNGQLSVVERSSIQLRNTLISRRSRLSESQRRSPSTQSSQLAPFQSRSQLISGSISRRNRFRRSFRGPFLDALSEMRVDGVLTFHRT